ncbi:MAG: pilus assembly protein FimV [Halioglobus sp.]|jgi:pilus assembly protein FimV
MARKLAAVMFSLGCIQASSVMALGLGELKLESFLNEPLKASVDLLNTDGLHQEEIKVRLATREDFDKLGLERAYFLTNITFEVVVDEKGNASIVLASDESVLEPYLDFIVEARWPSGRLLREYTVLIDPPVFTDAGPIISASEQVEAVEGIPAPAKKNKSTGATSGTRVDVKKSDLAPGAMPQRDFNASASANPQSGGRYMISRDETLWEIASKAKPEGVSVHQTMLDIQRLNPKAFINGNINQVKAGYIVYLPTAEDISSGDLSSALAEVKEQNSAWREGRAAEAYAASGPSLRISADPQEAAANSQGGSGGPEGEAGGGSVAATEAMDTATLDEMDTQERMAAMQQQVETLQRMVNLKDEQIAALQNAVGESAGQGEELDAAVAELEEAEAAFEVSVTSEEADVASESSAEMDEALVAEASQAEGAAEPESSESTSTADSDAVSVTQTSAEDTDTSGWLSYLLYSLGAAVLGVFAFLFIRSRRQDDEFDEPSPRVVGVADVFSEVKLKDPPLEMEPQLESVKPEAVDPTIEARGNRGYGGLKHDEYASDHEDSDALAEADIYIAYGRHPQAIDLLNNALANEPNSSVYRLKLIEIYAEQQDRGSATAQLEQLQALGDASSSAQGEALISAMDASEAETSAPPSEPQVDEVPDDSPGLAPNPLEMMSDAPLEAEFSGLEIEGVALSDDDELDLSADFDTGPVVVEDDEELVIAADANGLSTKLDLARAYLDMGDEDGAREILDEVVAEGGEELKAEARSLIDRIGG